MQTFHQNPKNYGNPDKQKAYFLSEKLVASSPALFAPLNLNLLLLLLHIQTLRIKSHSWILN